MQSGVYIVKKHNQYEVILNWEGSYSTLDVKKTLREAEIAAKNFASHIKAGGYTVLESAKEGN